MRMMLVIDSYSSFIMHFFPYSNALAFYVHVDNLDKKIYVNGALH